MKPYSILIHGTGACGEGNAQSADIALQKLLEQLRTSGHKLTSVSMVIDGSTVPIIGAMQPHPAADPGAVTLASISRQMELMLKGQDDLAAHIEAATEAEDGEVTPEVVNENVLKVLALVQPGAQATVFELTSKKKKKGAGVEEKLLNEPPKGAGLDAEGKPAVAGDLPDGEAQPPKDPPPNGVVETTKAEAGGSDELQSEG